LIGHNLGYFAGISKNYRCSKLSALINSFTEKGLAAEIMVRKDKRKKKRKMK
jgi:hypothetical protein